MDQRDSTIATRARETVAPIWELAFLASFSVNGNITQASRDSGIDRGTYYAHAKRDPWFVDLVEDAREAASDSLEEEARKRAVEGWEEPVYQGGELVGTILKKSDRLLEFLLLGNRPKKFRTNATIDGTVHVTIEINRGPAWEP